MPANTPILDLPYPLPADAVTDYPALGQSLATKLEALGGAAKLWDSTEAGVVYPTNTIWTPSLPQTRKHLLVVWRARSSVAAVADSLYLRFNNDAGANYHWQQMLAVAATAAGGQGINATSLYLGDVAGGQAEGATGGAGAYLIPGYATSGVRFSTVGLASAARLASSGASFFNVMVTGGRWAGVVPLTTLGFALAAGSFTGASDCRFTVYGLN